MESENVASPTSDAVASAGDLRPLAALPTLFAERRRLRAALEDVEALIAAHLAELERMEGEA